MLAVAPPSLRSVGVRGVQWKLKHLKASPWTVFISFHYNLQIDEMARVSLTPPLREKLGWKHVAEGDVIVMELCGSGEVSLRQWA